MKRPITPRGTPADPHAAPAPRSAWSLLLAVEAAAIGSALAALWLAGGLDLATVVGACVLAGALGGACAKALTLLGPSRTSRSRGPRRASVLPGGAAEELEGLRETRDVLGRLWREDIKERGAFVSKVTHELRTPLSVIVGYIEMLRMGVQGPLTPEQSAVLKTMGRNGQELTDMLSNLLDYSLLGAGLMPVSLGDVSLDRVVAGLDAVFRPRAAEGGVALSFAVPAGSVARAHEQTLTRLLRNLLSNALRATPPGGRVRLELRRGRREDVLAVTDTGPGIAPEQSAALFKQFSQIRGPEPQGRRARGIGLGLAVCRQFAEAYGGRIWYERQPGGGAGFFLALPRQAR
ncbi:MAG: HAMP domain-containing histidine kinase [Elusimicrobia bacterium]|nr:HAMP domain-containing histidine kinase [Elusimicrobiota bacterium]